MNEDVKKSEHAAEGIHPFAKPFLFLGHDKVKRNFMWLPLVGIIFGFIAYSLIVFTAPVLFKFLARDEGYYGEGGLPDPDYSTEHTHEGEH